MDDLLRVSSELKKADRIAILSHIIPDGDCIGSMLALGRALRQLGKEVIMVNSDPVPQYLSFLPGAREVMRPEEVSDWPALVVCVDCSDMGRLGDTLGALVKESKLVNIDHHVSNTGFGSINYVDSSAAATGQIVAALIEPLGISLDKELAAQIYTALVTDTGSFQYSNTTAEVHRLAALLISMGLDAARLNQQIYETRSLASVRLLGKALDSLQISADGKLAWIALARSTLEQLGAMDEHTEGIIGFTRSIDTVEIGILLREVGPGKIKVGFRSKQADVNKLAGVFGGGGHQRASGCVIFGSLEEAAQEVLAKAREFIANAGNH